MGAAAGNGLCTALNYLRGAAGNSLGTTIRYLQVGRNSPIHYNQRQ
jgi:hypothetical protein